MDFVKVHRGLYYVAGISDDYGIVHEFGYYYCFYGRKYVGYRYLSNDKFVYLADAKRWLEAYLERNCIV